MLGRVLGGLVALTGALVLAAWALDIPSLKAPISGVTMKANTALALVLAGTAACLLPAESRLRRSVVAFAGCALVLVGLVTASQDITGWNLGIDQALFADPEATTAPGRMAPATSLALALFGMAVLAALDPKGVLTADVLALFTAAGAGTVLMGYFYDVESLRAVGAQTTMAIHSAVAVLMLSGALLFAHAGTGLMAPLVSDSYGGTMARRVLPAAIVLPVVIGWARLQGEGAGYYGRGFGVALMASSMVLVVAGLIWWNAASLLRLEIERRHARRVIAERERVIMDTALDAVITINAAGRITYWNQRAEAIFGWRATEAIGADLAGLIMPDRYRERHKQGLERFLKTGEGRILNRRIELTALRRDRTEFPIELSIVALPFEGTYAFNAFLADITDRKQAERVLRESERDKASLLRLSKALDQAHTHSDVLRAALAEVQAIVGYRSVWAFLLAPDGATASLVTIEGEQSATVRERYPVIPVRGDAYLESIFASQGAVVVEDAQTDPRTNKEIVTALGNRTIVNVPMMFADRRLGAFGTGSFRDEGVLVPAPHQLDYLAAMAAHVAAAFDRIHLDEERARAARRFELAVESAPNAMVMVDGNGTIVLVNSQVERLTGYSRGELVGQPVELLVPERYRIQHAADRRGFMAAPGARAMGVGRDLFARRKDGSEFPVEIGLSPIETDQTPLVLAAIVDITQRKKAEQEILSLNAELEERVRRRTAELQAAYTELESFSYSVSHDLRAPLRYIDGFAKILAADYAAQLDADGQRYLGIISDGARNMGRMIDDLLHLSRIDRANLVMQPTDLGAIVSRVVDELSDDAPGRSIEWRIGELPVLNCDQGLMKLVFANLLGNAVKYTRRRETAVIEVGHLDSGAQPIVYVRDNGAGFDQKFAHKAFGVFQRLHRKEDFEGTGVGLATVQRIIRKHGGRIWAEAAVDKGAAFFFTVGDGTPADDPEMELDDGTRRD